MTTSRPDEPLRIIFVGLSLILAALLLYFALTSIPAASRPSLSPPTDAASSATPSHS